MQSLNLPEILQETLKGLGFNEPTPIQKKAIPFVLAGRDILGSAQTGTGKTGAFVIPIVAKIMGSAADTALILAPTRELAAQVMKVVHDFAPRKSGIKTALLIGGAHMGDQLRDLKKNPRIVVGTPGRVNDHIKRRTLDLRQTAFLVLDETDRMLDMGFGVQLDEIVKHLPVKRQTLMFSATLPQSIVKLSEKYLNAPERVAIGQTHQVALNIEQDMLHIKHTAKYPQLLKELEQREGSVIVFVKTKRGADELAGQLSDSEHSAEAIHGDLRQRERDHVIKAFRNKKHRILVATDVAARGLDIPHIEHVINYDLPQSPEDYIHRIGRTARAGSSGSAMSFVAPSDGIMWKEIVRLLQGTQGSALPAHFLHQEKKETPKKKFSFKSKHRFGQGRANPKRARTA